LTQKEWRYDKKLHNYSSSTWKKLRQSVFKRDQEKCVLCDKELVLNSGKHERKTNKANIHHIKPRSLGGTDTEDNLITLCTKCHYSVHKGGVDIGSKKND
jgi:ATP-dependent DNA helicase RecQ